MKRYCLCLQNTAVIRLRNIAYETRVKKIGVWGEGRNLARSASVLAREYTFSFQAAILDLVTAEGLGRGGISRGSDPPLLWINPLPVKHPIQS